MTRRAGFTLTEMVVTLAVLGMVTFFLTEVLVRQSRTYTVAFAFPPGMNLAGDDLAGLSFRWTLRYGNAHAEVTTSFDRVHRERVYVHPYYPYYPYYPYHGFSLSVGGSYTHHP